MLKLSLVILALLAGQANAQIITQGQPSRWLFPPDGVSVGNGADLTEDTLKTYTLAANTLTNVGDTIHIIAGGTMGGTTDNKTAQIRVGGTSVCNPNLNTATAIRWGCEVWITKTGSNTQAYTTLISSRGGAPLQSGQNVGTLGFTDTAPVAVTVTGQNATSSVSGSVTVQLVLGELIR